MRTFVRRATAVALASLAAVAIAGPVSACGSPNPALATQVTKASHKPVRPASAATSHNRETVSYAFWINATDPAAPYSDKTYGGLMNATNADYEATSPYCTVVELTPDVDAYACIGVPFAEAGPYADDSSYDVHFTDDGELVTSTDPAQVLDYWRWTF